MTDLVPLCTDILVRATPLILAGLAVALAFRAGILNIGADGQLLAGATLAATVGVKFGGVLGPMALPIALTAGTAAGAAWAWIASTLRTRFHVLEVISTIMLNFVAAYGVSYVVRGPLQESTHIYPQTEAIAAGTELPRIVPGTRLHLGIGLAIGIAVLLWWVLRYTAIGFRVRASGANSSAAWSAGMINVAQTTSLSFIISGGLAGLAGAVQVCGVTLALYEDISPGYGYTAIAVALLAGLHPIGVIVTGVTFGALEVAAGTLQRNVNIPATLASVIEASMILLVVVVRQLRSKR